VSEEDTDLFSNYENWFSRGDGVLIFLGPGSGSFWWSYHVLAAAGYEQVNQNGEDVLQLYFADPDTTSKPIDAQHPNPGFCGNLPADLQPFCIPTGNYNAADNFPWGGPIGTYDKSYYQECVINAAGIVQADPGNICLYAGAQVTSLFDIHPTPEPISLSLFATGLGLMAWRWRGRKSSQASAQ